MGQAPTGQQPASWEDVIRAVSKQHGVNPMLAIAVAKKESSLNPTAIGDEGKAIGMFQLHEGAAIDTQTKNRLDPLQNITGGVRYLKTLSDRYNGDLNKALMAYNGGADNVDKGTISPQAQAYAAEVLANLSGGVRQQARAGGGRMSGAGPVGTTVNPSAPGEISDTSIPTVGQMAYKAVEFVDPRTHEGRQNLAGIGGSAIMAATTKGLPVVSLTARVARVLGPVLGAATAGATEQATEESLGTAPSEPGSVLKAGATQAGYEAGGQLISWPLRRVGRTLAATSVARSAAEGLRTGVQTAKVAGRDAIAAVTQKVDDVVRATRATQAAAMSSVKQTGRQLTRDVRATASKALADEELAAADSIAEVGRQYDNLLAQPPSAFGTGAAVKATVEGPSKRALDIAGERVKDAALDGPELNITGVQDALRAMWGKARPGSIFGREQNTPGIGFLSNVTNLRPRQAAATMGQASEAESAALKKALSQALGVTEEHPLPGLLGKILEAPEKISFADAHQLKRLLDEAVTWDRTAKKSLEGITKGLRNTLRQTMADANYAPYEEATAAYQAVVPLYRKGIGLKIINQSRSPEGSARIAALLNANDPIAASAAKQLLVDQASAGGDAEMGAQAWNAVRSSYTYEKLLSGGVDNLGTRVEALLTQHPEFAKIVYGDPEGKQVLHNLSQLAEAMQQAETMGAANVSAVKQAGKAQTTQAVETATRGVEATKQAHEQQMLGVQQQGRAERRAVGKAAEEGVATAKEKENLFWQTPLSKFSRRSLESEAADTMRLAALGLKSWYGGQSLMRLLRSPSSADLLEYIAYSPQRTQQFVKVLTSPVPPVVIAATLRDLGHALGGATPNARVGTAQEAP